MTSEKMLPQVVGIILDEQAQLTLAELTRACAVHAELIIELVEEGALPRTEGKAKRVVDLRPKE